MSSGVLVAGVGNVLLGDDGFGVEVVNRLAHRPLPAAARVADFGIRGVHLAYELLDNYAALILVDAVPMSEPPGTLAVIEPRTGALYPASDELAPVIDGHRMGPDVVLAYLSRLGGKLDRVVVVGCQPANLAEGIGLSPAVAAAVDEAVDLCVELVGEVLESKTRMEDQG